MYWAGSNLRYFNFTKEIAARGHRVYLLLSDYALLDEPYREAFMAWARAELPISGLYYVKSPDRPVWDGLARKLVFPALVNHALRGAQSTMCARVVEIIDECEIDVCLSSVRSYLWLLTVLQQHAVTVMDWCDSESLANYRQIGFQWRNRQLRGIGGLLKRLVLSMIQEAYYGKRTDVNLVVSSIDKTWLNALAGAPERNYAIGNGVKIVPLPVRKKPKRLIFSGRMDFAPNYQSALWFIDHVFPLVVAKEPDVQLVIAGACPVPELKARSSANIRVTGAVPDLAAEIARSQLYVAPMVSGSGFKNKVVEAIAAGTLVVGTPFAFEFLDPDFRELLPMGDTPKKLAAQILTVLSSPEQFQDRLERARLLTAQRFQWGAITETLLEVLAAAGSRRPASLRDVTSSADALPRGVA